MVIKLILNSFKNLLILKSDKDRVVDKFNGKRKQIKQMCNDIVLLSYTCFAASSTHNFCT